MLAHPNVLAAYNAWANRRLHDICAKLSAEEIAQNRGAFFDSILGTLNHILLVDILYREPQRDITSGFSRVERSSIRGRCSMGQSHQRYRPRHIG